MGFFNLPEPVFNFLDKLMAMALPDLVRLIIWAICAAGLGMLLYRRLAPPKSDKTSSAKTSIAAIPLSISLLPSLFITVWLANTYEYEQPHPGTKVKFEIHSLLPEAPKKAAPDAPKKAAPDAPLKLRIDKFEKAWPKLSGRLVFRDTGSETGAALSASKIVPIVTKKKWWHAFFANQMGYIPAEFAIEKIKFDASPKKMIPLNSYWVSNWKLWFMLALGTSFFIFTRIFRKD